MSDNSHFALRLIAFSAILGLIGDLLIHGASWGVNFFLWMLALCLSGVLLAKSAPLKLAKSAAAMALPTLVFAACFAWRDSDELKVANATAIFFAVGSMMVFARAGGIREGSIGRFLGWTIARSFMLLAEVQNLGTKDVNWTEHAASGAGKQAAAVSRGLLLTVPLVILFGALFMNADAVFERFITRTFTFDAESLMTHLLTFGIATLVIGGLLRRLFLSIDAPPPVGPPIANPNKLGITETSIMLGCLNLLFLAFVGIQFKYLFGGASLVSVTSGLSYAQYARRGFFELVIVASLVLPLLLGLNAYVERERREHARLFNGLAGLLVLLVFFVIASAFQRMRIYQDAYGLTILRLYTTAFMVWLAATFAWLAATVLRGRTSRFAFGSLVAGSCVIFALNAINPDGLIARTNLSRPGADFSYLQGLSNDSLPAIQAALPSLPTTQRETMQTFLDHRRNLISQMDWREMNLADWRLAR